MRQISPFITGIVHPPQNSSTLRDPHAKPKAWGIEHQFHGAGYSTKIMEVLPGASCSLHFHKDKNETFVLVKGTLDVTFYRPNGDKVTERCEPYSVIMLPDCTPHTFSVPANQEECSIFIESSTPDSPGDSYRLTKSKRPKKNV